MLNLLLQLFHVAVQRPPRAAVGGLVHEVNALRRAGLGAGLGEVNQVVGHFRLAFLTTWVRKYGVALAYIGKEVVAYLEERRSLFLAKTTVLTLRLINPDTHYPCSVLSCPAG
jgi:hypothetical protein